MRLTTQIVLGHLGLVLSMVSLSALGISLVDRMSREDQVMMREVQAALVRLRPPGGVAVEAESAAERARGASESLQQAVDAAESSVAMARNGAGLIAVVGAVGLVLTLYFGYWLARVVTQPVERLARGIERIVAGDMARRFGGQVGSGAVGEMAISLDVLLDRLQRAESSPRTDLLLACAAVEKLCEAEPKAVGVLANGHRLIAANENARALVLERSSSLGWLSGEAQRRSPTEAEIFDLKGPSGDSLGQLVRLPILAAPAVKTQEVV